MKKIFLALFTVSAMTVFAQDQSSQETAHNYMRSGDWDNAILVLKNALQKDQSNLDLQKDLALSYLYKRDFTKALETVKPMLEREDVDVVTYQIGGNVYKALEMVKDAHDKGYQTTVNLMAVSTVPDYELNEGLEMLSRSAADAIYVVDSFGTLYSEQVQYLVRKYLGYCKSAGKEVGMHAHNNLQLAFANTIEAIVLGANMLDATMAGLGRGAGNCPMELLIGFLHNPKYDLLPVLRCVQNSIEPLRGQLGWGFDLPYMMTGLLNEHPRAAIKFKEARTKGDIVEFYNQIWD